MYVVQETKYESRKRKLRIFGQYQVVGLKDEDWNAKRSAAKNSAAGTEKENSPDKTE